MFVVVWRYAVRDGSRFEFEQAYGARGEWVEFFQGGDGYLGTELLRCADQDRYLTIDRWVSQTAYDDFARANRARYDAIDARCEALTLEEEFIGGFERGPNGRLDD